MQQGWKGKSWSTQCWAFAADDLHALRRRHVDSDDGGDWPPELGVDRIPEGGVKVCRMYEGFKGFQGLRGPATGVKARSGYARDLNNARLGG